MSKIDARRGWILEQLKDKGSIQVAEVVKQFSVSEATVRRDLEVLENEKKCIRTLGGAVLEIMKMETPFFKKLEINAEEKKQVAEKALGLIRDHDIIGLTGGTTNYFIAKRLDQFEGLTIVTNAINIAYELIGKPGLRLIVTGGTINTQSYELSGPLADGTLNRLSIQKTFVGVDGISLSRGITTFNEMEAETNRVMMQKSLQNYIVADHTKFNNSSLFVINDFGSVNGIITDDGVSPEIVRRYREAGISFN
ncbi:transcriptional regulator, DeoR family [Paenibacillus sp. UNC496MF]|uniref:DeoR/GlpR family DNA-binding transcription regulator n=1 Tax=Paenibacillus sp. UNC496MF TaxID=1502753 RepID=UPI0008E03525|nr:DeoR/GlpR family DNA-binding transcription regulator [Paenibacillus sp. UNC496MF]SFI80078.1 transcriptional regulator, DeoR family [Paenibacillus sp. UNC496MF]